MQPSLQQKTTGFGVEHLDLSRIAQDLQIRKLQVESVVELLDGGNTVPFITRYRKERTGGLDEEVIRTIQARIQAQRQLAERKQTILKSIEGQGKLTDDLRNAIVTADTPKRLEDLYLPYKPKKRTLATVARERGLEPLAAAIWTHAPETANLPEVLASLVNPEKELNKPEDVLLGVQHILAEIIAENADIRASVRNVLWDSGKICTNKSEKLAENQGREYKSYFQFTEAIRHIPPHRILAINRGEKENALMVKLEFDQEGVQRVTLEKLPLADHPHAEFLRGVAADALSRLLLPSLEREIRRELTSRAEGHAVKVFGATSAVCCWRRRFGAAGCWPLIRASAPDARSRLSTRPATCWKTALFIPILRKTRRPTPGPSCGNSSAGIRLPSSPSGTARPVERRKNSFRN